MTIAFSAMAADVSPFLPGCPTLVISHTMRKMAIDLCTWARVWRDDLTPISLVADQAEYTLTSPYAYARVESVASGHTIVDGNKRRLDPMPYAKAIALFPSWPEDYSSPSPQWIVTRDPGVIQLAPVPDTAGTMYLVAELVPTMDATEWSETLYGLFHRVLFHGTLAELMAMPERNWTDQKKAVDHQKEWSFLRASARTRADHDYTRQSLAVEMRPFA